MNPCGILNIPLALDGWNTLRQPIKDKDFAIRSTAAQINTAKQDISHFSNKGNKVNRKPQEELRSKLTRLLNNEIRE